MSRILHLTLKRGPFDMIAQGVKLEEYRDIKSHWNKIFTNHWCKKVKTEGRGPLKTWDIVHFTNGYGDHRPQIEVEFVNIHRGVGNTEWGASGIDQYIISLGKILSIKNYKQTQ